LRIWSARREGCNGAPKGTPPEIIAKLNAGGLHGGGNRRGPQSWFVDLTLVSVQ
jgi:hypothetical protein